MIKKVFHKKKLLALIINIKRNRKKGTKFFTPNNFVHQVGLINHPKDYVIKPHTHKNFLRKINKTSEVLYVKKGILRVDFYNNKKKYFLSKILKKDQIIILIEGSHGFKVLKKCELIEIKQGPFVKSLDKERFEKVNEKKIKIKN